MVLDTRVCNCFFREPPLTRLPTAAALASIEARDQFEVYFAGGDIDNAFYRIRVPDSAKKFMTLPRVKAKYVGECVVDDRRVGCETWVTPVLKVLPMGWSWSLWFC